MVDFNVIPSSLPRDSFVDWILGGTGNILIQLLQHKAILNAHPPTEY